MKDDKGFTLALSWIIGGGAALWICYLVGGFFGVSRAEAPAMIQAIGSIGAIIGSFAVVHHQHKLVAKRDDDLRKEKTAQDLANLIRSVETELNQHHARLLNVSQAYEDATKSELKKQAFPTTIYRTPVFDACASHIGTIGDDALRTTIIYVYTALGPFYEALNRNTELLRDFVNINENERRELAAIEDQLIKSAKDLASEIERIFKITGHTIIKND